MRSKATLETDRAESLGTDGFRGNRKRLRRWWFVLFVVTAAAVGVVAWRKTGNSPWVQYKTVEVQRGDLVVTVTATGNLEPTNQVDVGTEVSGTIESVRVDYNDQVKVGQVMASLETAKLKALALQSRAKLESARAKVLQACANVMEARNELARLRQVRELSGNKVPSQHDLDAAEAALERALAEEAGAKAEVMEAQATLEANETDLSKAVIHSPINGIVLVRDAEPGQTVAASFQAPVLFTLAENLRKMELHVDVDEADVGDVKEGQESTFAVDAYPDRTFPARITQVRYGSQTTDGVVTYKTLLEVDNSDLALRPGMTATAEITVRKVESAILVPNSALRFSPPMEEREAPDKGAGILQRLLPGPPRSPPKRPEGQATPQKGPSVWTVRKGQLVPIPVQTGATDGIMSEVTGGEVEPGMELVVDTVSVSR